MSNIITRVLLVCEENLDDSRMCTTGGDSFKGFEIKT